VINGLVSLRAYERIPYYKELFVDQLEKSCNLTFTNFIVLRWICMVLDWICIGFTFIVAGLSVYAKGKVDPEILAFSLQIITDVVVFFGYSLRTFAEVENYFTSVQRIYEYTQLESEDDLIKEKDSSVCDSVTKQWPPHGEIEFKNVTMTYREGLEPSLKHLDFRVQPRMKVGIVGRTGAGKSSIIQTIFRLCDI
jgi:ABC-type multidrug transport system fused ATPase/permease subunit